MGNTAATLQHLQVVSFPTFFMNINLSISKPSQRVGIGIYCLSPSPAPLDSGVLPFERDGRRRRVRAGRAAEARVKAGLAVASAGASRTGGGECGCERAGRRRARSGTARERDREWKTWWRVPAAARPGGGGPRSRSVNSDYCRPRRPGPSDRHRKTRSGNGPTEEEESPAAGR